MHATFTGLSLPAITSFLCLELSQVVDGEELTSRVVVNARLTGAPDDRFQRILTAALKSKGDVLRYLLFLLADVGDPNAVDVVARLVSTHGTGDGPPAANIPLFESIVHALYSNPDSLDHMNRLIVDLQRTPEGRELLPDGLDELWPAVEQARRDMDP